jgi:hypothetical protein
MVRLALTTGHVNGKPGLFSGRRALRHGAWRVVGIQHGAQHNSIKEKFALVILKGKSVEIPARRNRGDTR